MRRLASVGVLALASMAQGRAGWVFAVEYEPGHASVNPAAPTATVRVGAFFSPPDHAFAAARWDFWSDDSTWNHAYNLAPFTTNGPPVISGPRVLNCIAGQIHFPPNLPADPSNPAWVMEAEWVTQDFRRRTVGVTSRTARFDVYVSRTSPESSSRLSVLVEGHGEILVTPAPGAACLLAGALIPRRRR